MGCSHSKKKSKSRKGEKVVSRQQDGGGGGGDRCPSGQSECLEKQLERFEWQLRILKEVLSANGNPERAELLREHAEEEVCALVSSIFDKVKTETTADLNVLHEQKNKIREEEHDRLLEDLQRKHQQKTETLTQQFQQTENSLKASVSELRAELQTFNDLKRRVAESSFHRDLQRNIQAHGSPGAFWESEQESLLFVIEMKSQRVQEQNRKLTNMEELVQRNVSLEDQTLHVLQQNEDLRVRIDNYQTLIQQLSAEQQDLRGALERQAGLNQTLVQEKEELVFKLRHRDACSTIHLLAEVGPR